LLKTVKFNLPVSILVAPCKCFYNSFAASEAFSIALSSTVVFICILEILDNVVDKSSNWRFAYVESACI
jgi:hypothetical protein